MTVVFWHHHDLTFKESEQRLEWIDDLNATEDPGYRRVYVDEFDFGFEITFCSENDALAFKLKFPDVCS